MTTRPIPLTSEEFRLRVVRAVHTYEEIKKEATGALVLLMRDYVSSAVQTDLGFACLAAVKAELFPARMNPAVLYKGVLDEIRLSMPHQENMEPVYKDYLYIFTNEGSILEDRNALKRKWEFGNPPHDLDLF